MNIDSCGRRVFSVVLPFLWNSRPQNVRDAESLEIFRLKTAGNCLFLLIDDMLFYISLFCFSCNGIFQISFCKKRLWTLGKGHFIKCLIIVIVIIVVVVVVIVMTMIVK